ncbi:hypothetical protein PQU92_00495 [Asticcacaulis sp. BYS171W]|uniref:Uncharacterized protein n=1 Tax=Asticcacaulis aquaticus TaxID=2984212 RepID=A0ABT5HP47_9CAUL|nr:hypothetical protein [Asticcacaulis aquaticus]MDC7681742.1 hypothetical protein [Asticcacaulis aquaticus]
MRENLIPKLEFRIPISPTPGFFKQVELFNYCLRQLGGAYEECLLTVVVGDECNIDWVKSENPWSRNFNISWQAVPVDIFREFGIHGTANWRLCIPSSADIIILSDADTILTKDIDPLFSVLCRDDPVIIGHMAHFPPPISIAPSDGYERGGKYFWSDIFDRFDIEWPSVLHNYSMTNAESSVPAYFNLGFVGLNASALSSIGKHVLDYERRFKEICDSHMRCQIILTLMSYKLGFNIGVLPAQYNAANDPEHIRLNYISEDDIRVMHYLRESEFRRSTFLTPNEIIGFLDSKLELPCNKLLQKIVKNFYIKNGKI